MPIALPVPGTTVSTSAFGIPVVNALTALSIHTSSVATALTTSGTTVATVISLVIPAQAVAGKLIVGGILYRTQSVAGDQFDTSIYNPAGAVVATVRNSGLENSGVVITAGMTLAASTAATYTMRLARGAGTGVANTFNINYLSQMFALFIPT